MKNHLFTINSLYSQNFPGSQVSAEILRYSRDHRSHSVGKLNKTERILVGAMDARRELYILEYT